jgi:glycosyltransferase involved in cell wall biosynthesis
MVRWHSLAALLVVALYKNNFKRVYQEVSKYYVALVCIIQPVMKQYRLPFFIGLEKELANYGVGLQIVYGEPLPEETKRGDNAELPAPLGRRVPTYRIFRKLFIQPSFLPWLHADLVVLEPANKHALNYVLMLLHGLGLKRIAYWGHGYDRQSNPGTFGNRIKRRTLHWVNWWFAYTRGAADYVAGQGFGPARITVVENAIDTGELRSQLSDISQAEMGKARDELGWDAKSRIGIFCGSLYANKKLDLLFAGAQLIYDRNPSFRLLILGGGPLEAEVRDFTRNRDWVRYKGPVFGRDKAMMLKIAEFWLNPGLVGLGILDGFCAGLPVITTSVTFHSPEIEYLENGRNGLMVSPDADSYAAAVLNLLDDDELFSRLRQGALAAGERYNIEKMVANFADGVRKCLNLS